MNIEIASDVAGKITLEPSERLKASLERLSPNNRELVIDNIERLCYAVFETVAEASHLIAKDPEKMHLLTAFVAREAKACNDMDRAIATAK